MTNVYFKDIDKLIKNTLRESKSDVKIAVAWITNTEIIAIIEQCLGRGISVTIIFFNDKINKIELFERLHRNGAVLKCTNTLMHNKFCIVDNQLVINGSYNWTKSAKSNDENIQVTQSVEVANSFLEEFERIFRKAHSVNKFFADNDHAFTNYIQKIGIPEKYPVFFRLDLDNKLIRNSILESAISLQIGYVYKCFYNEDEYKKFIQKVYKIVHTRNIEKIRILIGTSVNLQNTGYSTDCYGLRTSFIAIDIIRDVSLIKNITSQSYIDDNIRLSDEVFIYFDEIEKDNILLIGYYEHSTKKLNDRLLLITIKNTSEFNEIRKYEFNVLDSDNEFLTIGSPIIVDVYGKRQQMIHKYFIKVKNFQFDNSATQLHNDEQRNILRSIAKKNIEVMPASEKIINQYKDKQQCYLATMVYHDVNHENLIKLREYRNEVLLATLPGFLFVKFYYKISPSFVKILRNSRIINFYLKIIIDKLVSRLK